MSAEETELQELREKRMAFLIAVWDFLVSRGFLDETRLKLSLPLLQEVVEHYLDDLTVLKVRYRIPKLAQLHKVAGLMTAVILRYRPIIPLVETYENKKEIFANEIFAAMHGIAICGEYSIKKCEELGSEAWFDIWMNDFLHLLHRRNHTPESLVFVYETLSIFVFPDNLQKQDSKKIINEDEESADS